MLGKECVTARMAALFVLITLFALQTVGAPPAAPGDDPSFLRLPDGRHLSNVRVRGQRLALERGLGQRLTAADRHQFEQLLHSTRQTEGHPVQWVFMDLDSHRVIDQSKNSRQKVFGASVSKIFVAATYLHRAQGRLQGTSDLQLLADMLVQSSNSAWISLQKLIGGGNPNRGRERIHDFTQSMGYERTRGFQGYWGNLHGNELTADELAEFLYDTYQGHYEGSEILWKIMHTCRTGLYRARKYIPSSIHVGGKTGTFDGETIDPESGRKTHPDGTPYTVQVRHHVVVFNVDRRQYALAVLANTGSDQSSALLAGGLLREHILGW